MATERKGEHYTLNIKCITVIALISSIIDQSIDWSFDGYVHKYVTYFFFIYLHQYLCRYYAYFAGDFFFEFEMANARVKNMQRHQYKNKVYRCECLSSWNKQQF